MAALYLLLLSVFSVFSFFSVLEKGGCRIAALHLLLGSARGICVQVLIWTN